MTDLLLQIGLSNACFALALAIVAMVVGRAARRPQLAHVLWLLVFVKLITPPIVSIPVVPIPDQPQAAAFDSHLPSGAPNAGGQELDVSQPPPLVGSNRPSDAGEKPGTSLVPSVAAVVREYGKRWLPPVWLLGSVFVFVWSLVRVCRFGRLLAAESVIAPQPLQDAAARMARRLKLKLVPMICTTSARLSPMVWWAGGKVRIVIPATLLDRMDARQWRLILAHELAHVRRRDYLVRWIEWLACVCFWWNPVVWWARRNLRANEELCCDALVLSRLAPQPRTYAKSLLAAVEFLACPALRPPAMASEINSGGFLARRFKMIVSVSETPNRMGSRWLRACVLLCAIVVLPFGVARAHDPGAVERRLREAVKKGEITQKQAEVMMGALKKATAEGKGRHDEKRRKEGPGMEARLKSIGARLKAAVKRGEMSEKEARAKWEAISKGMRARGKGDRKRGQDDRARVDAHLREVWAKLQAAVKAGKLSEEDAHKKMGEVKREVFAKLKGEGGREHGKGDRARVDAHLREVWAKLQAAVKAGKLSEKDAHEKMGAIKREVLAKLKGEGDRKHGKGDRARVDAHLREVWAQLQAAVKAGKLSEKDAHEKMGAIKREVLAKLKGEGDRKHGKGDRAHEWLMKVRKDLGAALKAGKISKEDAAKRFAAAERAIKARMAAGRGERDSKRGTEDALSRAGIEIRKAVAAGKITKEQGRAKMEAIRKKMGRQGERGAERGATKKPTRVDWEGIKRRIEGAVKRGDITREQADAKYKEIKERMGRQGER